MLPLFQYILDMILTKIKTSVYFDYFTPDQNLPCQNYLHSHFCSFHSKSKFKKILISNHYRDKKSTHFIHICNENSVRKTYRKERKFM